MTLFSPSVAEPGLGARRRTQVCLVCSPQGRVGKTLTARLLLDHTLGRTRTALGFDANHLDPGLALVFPRQTTVIDLASTHGQMVLFDQLVVPNGTPKIVDLWHGGYDLFWKLAGDLDFFEEVGSRGIDVLVFLQTDRRERFTDQISTLLARWPRLKLILVHNEGLVGPRRPLFYRAETWRAEQMVLIPSLDPTLQRILEEPRILVHRLLHAAVPDAYAGLQARTRAVLAPVFNQFEFIEMGLMLEHDGFRG